MREYERKIAEAEMKVGAGAVGGGARLKEPLPRGGADIEDAASSSAQDPGSDGSISDVPVSFTCILNFYK